MTMYQRIKQLRAEKRMSQQDLALLTGYQDRSSIAKIESGAVDLPQSKILLFAKALGVTPAQLMGLSDVIPSDLVEDVLTAPEEKREELARRYGLDPSVFCSQNNSSQINLTEHERKVVLAYRSHPELQAAVDRVLLLEQEPPVHSKHA